MFDILHDDLGKIRFEDNKFVLKSIYLMSPLQTTMNLLGKIAEAVIVRRCVENEDINKKWLSVARRKKAKAKTAERFMAVGTGLIKTKQQYPQYYNPSDTQRDIIWVDDDGMRAMIKTSSISGLEARELLMNQAFQGMPSDEIILEKNFVRASAIDYQGYEEVCLYEELVMALIKGKITVDSLLTHKIVENSNTMKNSIISATMSQLPIQNIILK